MGYTSWMKWRDAVWGAVQRQATLEGGAFTREQLIEQQIVQVKEDTGSTGVTPAQTMSRVLQELRDEGVVIFDGNGRYRLAEVSAGKADVEDAVRTQVEQRILARLGQGGFRNRLLFRWGNRCPLTGIGDAGLLRASHIVPWGKCRSEDERLDPENGLLLSALWDAAFDRGLVSFDDDGRALRMPKLSGQAWAVLVGSGDGRLDELTGGNRQRLALHRKYCVSGKWITG